MKEDSIKKNYIYNLLFQILNLILPLITTPYISRVLGASQIGIYSYTYSYISTFVMVGSLGIGTYGQREIAAVNEDKTAYSTVFWEIQAVKTISVSASLIAYLGFAFLYKDYSFYLLIQMPYFIAAILDISWFFQGIEKFKFVALRNVVIKLVSLALIFILVKSINDLPMYVILLCVSQLIGNLTMWANLKKYIENVKIPLSALKKHIVPTFVYFIPTVTYQIRAILDKTMLGLIYNDNAENGYYEQANKIVSMATMAVSSYNTVMRSRMTNLYEKHDRKLFDENLNNALHFICMLIYPIAFGMAAIASNLIPWFMGEGYSEVVTLLYVFCPLFIFQGLRSCIGSNIVTPSGQQSKGNICQGISALVNVILNWMLIRHIASIGAAIASVVAEIVLFIGYMHYTKEYVRYTMIIKTSLKYCLAGIIMFVPTYILGEYLPSNLISTLTIILTGASIYFVSLIIMRDKYFKIQCKSTISALRVRLRKVRRQV